MTVSFAAVTQVNSYNSSKDYEEGGNDYCNQYPHPSRSTGLFTVITDVIWFGRIRHYILKVLYT